MRKAKGLTQKELADLIGVHTLTISEWERGKTSPRPKYIPELSKALGLEPVVLPYKGEREGDPIGLLRAYMVRKFESGLVLVPPGKLVQLDGEIDTLFEKYLEHMGLPK